MIYGEVTFYIIDSLFERLVQTGNIVSCVKDAITLSLGPRIV